jgi:hypothetical protein
VLGGRSASPRRALAQRLVERFMQVAAEGGTRATFPGATDAGDADLTGIGLTQQRAATLARSHARSAMEA